MKTTEQLEHLSNKLREVAIRADVERKLFISTGNNSGAVSIAELMRLVWGLFRLCQRFQIENASLREETRIAEWFIKNHAQEFEAYQRRLLN